VPDQAAPAHHPSLLRSLAWTRAHALEAIEGLPKAYADVVTAYREEAAHSDRIIAALAPDAVPRWEQGAGGRADLTSVILHVLVDSATHAGHLDIMREGIDRKQFLIVHP
jgi:hypothetical protein